MHISVNMSMTADGKANLAGKRHLRRMGGEADKVRMKRLRREVDAILVGSRTIKFDNASLRVPREFRRETEGGLVYPMRIAVVGKWIPPSDCKVFDPNLGGTAFVACGKGSLEKVREKIPAVKAIECGEDRRVEIKILSEKLENEFGVRKLLVEGGPTINGLFLQADLIDRYYITVCPYIFGGVGDGILTPIGGQAMENMNDRRFSLSEIERLQDWLFLTYERKR